MRRTVSAVHSEVGSPHTGVRSQAYICHSVGERIITLFNKNTERDEYGALLVAPPRGHYPLTRVSCRGDVKLKLKLSSRSFMLLGGAGCGQVVKPRKRSSAMVAASLLRALRKLLSTNQ